MGGDVIEGKAISGVKARLIRNKELISELNITEIESGKQKVSEVAEGQQAGLRVEGNVQVEEDDILEIFNEEEK